MDEKEFLYDEVCTIQEEEVLNLDNTLEKIDDLISSYEQKKKNCEEYCEEYKGDYENYNAFLEYSNRIKYIVNEIDEIKKISNSPYFVHMLLEESKQDIDMFIGYVGLSDEKGNNIVYDWRSEVGNLAYSNKTDLSYNGYYYKMIFRRKLEIQKRKLIDCVEEYNSNPEKQIKITDYFLRNVLKSKKSNATFTDIISTIQKKQNDIIRLDFDKSILCQGVAGSGKTAIIVHRLSYLLYNYPEISAEKYLFIAPNDNFKKELNELNIKLGINKIKISTLLEFYKEKINYYLNFDNSKKNEIKNIINDDVTDKKIIRHIYSNNFLESKYKILERHMYKMINPIASNYVYLFDRKTSFVSNIINLKKLIENNISNFNQKKKELRINVEKILKIIDKILPNLNSLLLNKENANYEYYYSKFESLINYYKYKINDNLKSFNLIFDDFNCENIEDFEIYINNINNKFLEIMKTKEKLLTETNKIENSIFKNFKIKKILENNNLINKYEQEINSISKKIECYKHNEDVYKETLMNNNNYNSEIKKIKNLLIIVNKMSIVEKSYKKLLITFDISEFSFNTFINKIFKFLEFISDNIDYVSIEDINNILLCIDNIISCDKEVDIQTNSKDKKNFKMLQSIYNPNFVIKSCFDILLNNKYSFSEDSFKKKNFYRNDIFMILYILNKLEFRKQEKYKYLYIDEAQDYNDEEIKLLKELEANPIINIFGDYNQNISLNSINRNNWKKLIDSIGENIYYFELNENYRNTINVVNYCNRTLNSDMLGIGIEGKDVEFKNEISLQELVELSKNNKSIIITNNSKIIKNISNLNQDIICHTISDVKGLEFENVIVVNDGLNINNKYVAYTRTKKDLLIVEKVLI